MNDNMLDFEPIHINSRKKVFLRFIDDISKDPNSKPFRHPVDESRDQAEDYYKIISDPMDLETLKGLVKENRISYEDEFIHKLNLIWTNAMQYNANENHTVHKKAKQMKILTHKLIQKHFPNTDNLKNIIATRKSKRIKNKQQQMKSNEQKENETIIFESSMSFCHEYECHLGDGIVQYDGDKRSAAPSLPPKVEFPEADTQANNVPQPHIPSYNDNKRSAAPSLPPVDEALFAADNLAYSLSNDGTTISLPSIIHGNDLCMMQGPTELHQAHSSEISCETAKSRENEIQYQFQIFKTLTEKLRQKENKILSLESRIESMKTQNIDYLKQLLIKYNNIKTAFVRLESAFKEMETGMRHFK